MRRGIWVGAAILVVAAAAVPLWLVLDDGGERRAAALTEPVSSIRPRLTIPGVNEGKPFGVDSVRWGATRLAKGAELHDLEITLEVTEISPQLFDIAAPSAKLELIKTDETGVPAVVLTCEFSDVVIHTYEDRATENAALTKSGGLPPRGVTTARLRFASVSERFAATPATPPTFGRMTVSSAERGPVAILDYQFGFERRSDGGVVPNKLMVTHEIDKLAPWFSGAALRGTPEGTNVTLELLKPVEGSGELEVSAVYDISGVTVESVSHFDDAHDQAPAFQEVALFFASIRLTSGGARAAVAPSG